MLHTKLSAQASATLRASEQPMRGILTATIDVLAATDGREPASDPVPLLFPERQAFVEDLSGPLERWRIAFCTYPEKGLLHIPVIERAPVF